LHWPEPLQVPAPLAHALPDAFGEKPHWPVVHATLRHSLVVAGQSLGAWHCTQAPPTQSGVAPEHALPADHCPFASQLSGTSPVQRLSPG
jgi:hypothetical protein